MSAPKVGPDDYADFLTAAPEAYPAAEARTQAGAGGALAVDDPTPGGPHATSTGLAGRHRPRLGSSRPAAVGRGRPQAPEDTPASAPGARLPGSGEVGVLGVAARDGGTDHSAAGPSPGRDTGSRHPQLRNTYCCPASKPATTS